MRDEGGEKEIKRLNMMEKRGREGDLKIIYEGRGWREGDLKIEYDGRGWIAGD